MKISIITPVYMSESFLHNFIDSISGQTYENWECICTVDASPDNSEKIIRKQTKADKRFILVSHKENQGISAARNSALKKATGDYIIFVDPDDFIHPQTLSILAEIIKETKCDCVQFEFKKVSNTNVNFEIIKNISYKEYKNPLLLLINKKIKSNACSKIYKTSVIKNVKFVEGSIFEDLPFNVEALYECKNIIITDEILYFYRKNNIGVVHSSFNLFKVKSYIKVINHIYDFIAKNKPEYLELTKQKILNERIKMIMNSGIRKQRDPEKRMEIFKFMHASFGMLFKAGKISFKGMKIWHKISLYLILKNKLKTAIFWRIIRTMGGVKSDYK